MTSEDISKVVPLHVPIDSPATDNIEETGVQEVGQLLQQRSSQSGKVRENSLKAGSLDLVTKSPIANEGDRVVDASQLEFGQQTSKTSKSSNGCNSNSMGCNSRVSFAPAISIGDRRHVKLEVLTETPKTSQISALTPSSSTSAQTKKSNKSVSFRASDTSHGSHEGGRQTRIGHREGGASRVTKGRVSMYPGRSPESNGHGGKPTGRVSVTESVRHSIQCTKWYHGEATHKVRQFLHGGVFITIMSVALFIALFVPDLWIVCGINSNPDIILTMVLVLFIFELISLSLLDVTYLLGFFFFMDIIGTISMIFDISYMVGADNTKIVTIQGGENGAKSSLMLLRAARAAKLGARAGRLSRIIKILRFLPFLGGSGEEEAKGYTGQMSRHLSNLLGTRVACLTILLVIAIPVIDILSFPSEDAAFQTWVERLDEDRRIGNSTLADMAYARDAVAMVSFFDQRDYGPYMACPGYTQGDDFIIHQSACLVGNFEYAAPNRGASALWVHTDSFMVGFNMQFPLMVDHVIAMVSTTFIIVVMIFSALALSNVVTTLAVVPLETMLIQVRTIAETVFNFSKEIISQGDDAGEDFEVDMSLELQLLEKVVQKLAIVATLQNGESAPHMEEGMATEDIAVLNMMEGRDVTQDAPRNPPTTTTSKDAGDSDKQPTINRIPTMDISEIGVTLEIFNSHAFNTLVLQPAQMITCGVYITSRFHKGGNGFINTEDDLAKLKAFVTEAERKYLQNQFHNFCHAIDVLHGAAKMMRLISSGSFLKEIDQFALLIAAIGHDLAHPGVNNGFLLEVQHELALQYNDLSPLENMHVSKLYGIVAKEETNVFHALTKEQYNQVRKSCIEAILHTDMVSHNSMVKDLESLFLVNQDALTKGKIADREEVFHKPDNKTLLINNILHSADVSNPCRTWDVSHAWAHRVLDEFFAQGDEEKKRGIPVQPLNDRDKINRPNSQIGFLGFMIAPFFAAQVKVFHALYEYVDNLAYNIGKWEELWAKETEPDAESRAKAKGRIESVRATLLQAKQASVLQDSVHRISWANQ